MMSHYGLPYEYDDPWICGALELSIETLTGTAFEIRVSPNDTIMSIKTKIQRVEGIPVTQQHLLYNLEELDNSASVRDYSIQNGATLKLVLSMRGGPISTRRLPPVDEMAWRELQELMLDSRREDLFERLPSGSRVTVLVFRDGDQVNLFRVVENEDGTYSPLSESWSGTSIRNLFAEEDPEDSAKRLQENSVTMGKMQELKEKLESLSIQRKEKKTDETSPPESPVERSRGEEAGRGDAAMALPRKHEVLNNLEFGDAAGQTRCVKLIRRTQEQEESEQFRPRRRLVSCSKASMTGRSKARKEAENIIRMQTKSLSVFVDAEQAFNIKRAPLPEIRRSPTDEENKSDDEDDLSKSLREKTASRVPASSFAIVEEENEVPSTSSICSSQGSMVAMPSNEEVAIAFSPMPRERVSTTVGRSRYRVSRYVLDNDQRPKTTPGKPDKRQAQPNRQFIVADSEARNRTKHIISTFSSLDLLQDVPKNNAKEIEKSQPKKRSSLNVTRNVLRPSFKEEVVPLLAPSTHKLSPPIVKKKLRCLQCKKKLNITNNHTCRCGNIFCSIHRYSEVHNCPFDYKEEGKKLLQQSNPLVAAPKLPKI